MPDMLERAIVVVDVSDEQRHAAAVTIRRHARDEQDAQELLAMLAITD